MVETFYVWFFGPTFAKGAFAASFAGAIVVACVALITFAHWVSRR